MGRKRRMAAGGLLGLAATALWWRKNPSACPYGQRALLEIPRPIITRQRLFEVLQPKPGERILEVGPGTGFYSIAVARDMLPDGILDVIDVQQEMLDHTMRRAMDANVTNIAPTLGDARDLKYPEDGFDGAFLVTVLGEIPDQNRTLDELARVIKPGGRLVVGEIFGDPHMVSLGALRRRAERAGFRFEEHSGNKLGFFARFSRPEGASVSAGSSN